MATITTYNQLADRAMSSFALSIGTALALESVFTGDRPAYDPQRQIPQRIKITDYDELWVNLGTLLRNMYSSVPSGTQANLGAEDLYLTLEQEAQIIGSLVREASNERVKLVLYATDDTRLRAKHPHAKLRQDVTARQISYSALTQMVLKEYLKRHSNLPGIRVYHEQLAPPKKTTALILTHDAYDLLSYKAFEKLDLLESHTGLLKPKALWYTKYTNGKDLMRIPFNSCFMQVFGDSVHFHPFAIKDRQAVKELADRYTWTALTTKERLNYCIGQLADVVLSQQLRSMLAE